MPEGNRFRHQAYTDTPPTSPHHVVTPGSLPPVGSSEFRTRMQEVGASFRAAGVTAIYLVHGSCVGPDALRVLLKLARAFPLAAAPIRRLIRRTLHDLRAEYANYTESYARLFEAAVNPPGAETIPVRLFEWSSENHHLGRADGAVRLAARLASLDPDTSHRVLLWGHGHAGNVFALLTNLLAADRKTAQRFFSAAEVYYRWPLPRCVDIPVWHAVREILARFGGLPADVSLDVVTFGTPVRYGWDSGGYSRLLHFINRRPVDGLAVYRAVFPPEVDDVLVAAEGDYVQQLGIAGTNVRPTMLAWRARTADRRLGRLLEAGLAQRSAVQRFQAGMIVPEEGSTLLVDYGRPDGSIAQHHAGHAVYTRKDWLLFHAEEVAQQFYSAEVRKAA